MISVLMSIYNENLSWIQQSIESILGQTYRDFEFIIIVDNPYIGDEIIEFLDRQCENDGRIKLIRNEQNVGLARSLNLGIHIASGDYIARMDADDISEKNRFEREIQFIKEGEYDLVSAYKINIDENGNEIGVDLPIDRNPNKVLRYSNIIVHPLVLVKTEVLKRLNGYRLLINSEDLDLWLRMIDSGYRLGILKEYLLRYRVRFNSASVERQLEQYYINKYIIKLMKERKENGKDSFSIEHQREYIKNKKITDKKKRKFFYANKNIEIALREINNRRYLGSMWYILCATICFPQLTIDKLYNYYHSNLERYKLSE
ncbi:MAG: glycosyltransferase [Hungatella sp.]|nr:glycosyltransferase [Hungatella sp.]